MFVDLVGKVAIGAKEDPTGMNNSIGYPLLRSPLLDVCELLKQAAHSSPRFPIEVKNSVCVKKFASCFGNSHTSKSGRTTQERISY